MAGTFTNLLYHLVFSTKNRQPWITVEVQDELYRYLGGIVRGDGGTLLEINGIADHVHLLVKLKPTRAVSEILQRIKGNSSKWLKRKTADSQVRLAGWLRGIHRERVAG